MLSVLVLSLLCPCCSFGTAVFYYFNPIVVFDNAVDGDIVVVVIVVVAVLWVLLLLLHLLLFSLVWWL